MAKKLLIISLLCTFGVAPAFADVYLGVANITHVPGYYSGDGGEFTIYNSVLNTNAYRLNPRTKNLLAPESFQSFCVERDEYITIPDTVEIWMSTTFQDGSPGSKAEMGGSNTNDGDDLDARTAYLYTQFASGKLTGYVYSGAGRVNSAYALQRVVWNLEGELNVTFASGTQERKWLDAANAAVAEGGVWHDVGIGDVRVLNLIDPASKTNLQDQLYLMPVPGAVLLGLLGLSAAGLKLRRFA